MKPAPPAATLPVTTDAEWIDLEGLQARLEKEKGRVVVVNYWATWCEPCREEFPDLVELQRRYHDRGVTVLAVSLDSPGERETEVKKFLAEQRPVFPVFLKTDKEDPDTFINAINKEWTGELPATFLYDRRGNRTGAYLGKQTLSSLEAAVKPLL